VVNATARLLYPQGKIRYPLYGWTPEPVWTGAESLATIGIRSPDCSARSESLYRLSYPGPQKDSNVEFYENPSSGSSVVLGRTDMTKLIVPFAVLRTRLKFLE
jgi:hypothetical protein